MNKSIINQCEEIAKKYIYSSGEVFGLYNLIGDCRKSLNLREYTKQEQFDELIKVLDFSSNGMVNPSAVIDFMYTLRKTNNG